MDYGLVSLYKYSILSTSFKIKLPNYLQNYRLNFDFKYTTVFKTHLLISYLYTKKGVSHLKKNNFVSERSFLILHKQNLSILKYGS